MQVQRAGPLVALAAIGLVALSIGGLAARGASPAEVFDDLYRRGQEQNGNLRTFTALFHETSTSSMLTRPLEARGTVSVERPGRVALHYAEPNERAIIIDGDRMTISWPTRGVLQTKDIGASQRRVRKYFVDGSPDELRRHFQVTAVEAAGGYVVTMVPTRKQIKAGIAELDLRVDPTSLLMTSMKMTFPNGDTKTMTFTNVRPNAALDPAVFRVPAAASR